MSFLEKPIFGPFMFHFLVGPGLSCDKPATSSGQLLTPSPFRPRPLPLPRTDYVLKPLGGETLGFDIANVPGLSGFVREQVHANLGPMVRHEPSPAGRLLRVPTADRSTLWP